MCSLSSPATTLISMPGSIRTSGMRPRSSPGRRRRAMCRGRRSRATRADLRLIRASRAHPNHLIKCYERADQRRAQQVSSGVASSERSARAELAGDLTAPSTASRSGTGGVAAPSSASRSACKARAFHLPDFVQASSAGSSAAADQSARRQLLESAIECAHARAVIFAARASRRSVHEAARETRRSRCEPESKCIRLIASGSKVELGVTKSPANPSAQTLAQL